MDKQQKNKEIEEYVKKKIGGYLAGLYEGDGHIWIQKDCGKKRHNPKFQITFNIKDQNQAQMLIEGISHGYLTLYPKKNACKLTIGTVRGLKKIIELMSDYLRTPKINQVNDLIKWLNKNHNTAYELKKINTTDLYEDGWLSGFLDSDGNFMIRLTKKENGAKKTRIACRVRIDQQRSYKKTNESFEPIMSAISQKLNGKSSPSIRTQVKESYFVVEGSTLTYLLNLSNYLYKYRLYSTKFYDFLNWNECLQLLKHKTAYLNLNKIETLKNQMNNKREKGIALKDVIELKNLLTNML
uniref:Endonuclease ai1 n=1 Tax=Cavenderia fasciculata TaxID=261658 RepID=B2XX70_CACFS|nr:endonuclease ai1 [Cavenderia fasciculata]ABX45192.1 endonuclease ai1 [Cavenderia fasciculata]